MADATSRVDVFQELFHAFDPCVFRYIKFDFEAKQFGIVYVSTKPSALPLRYSRIGAQGVTSVKLADIPRGRTDSCFPVSTEYNFVVCGPKIGHSCKICIEKQILSDWLPAVLRRLRRVSRDYVSEVFLYTYFSPCASCVGLIEKLLNDMRTDVDSPSLIVGYSKLYGKRNKARKRCQRLEQSLASHGGELIYVPYEY